MSATATSPAKPAYLFTAFEPSGDAHAAPVIRAIRQRQPEATIVATGGPKMEAAGATLIAETVGNAAMGLSAVGRIFEHKRVTRQVSDWLAQHGQDLHTLIPVDSPAANWSFCELIRTQQAGARIVHLVAPQLWAWGAGRVNKLRRLTDHVLCLLPFEPDWFESRNVPATFIGHPLFNETQEDAHGRRVIAEGVGPDAPHQTSPSRLALLPGSRAAEVRKNWPTMLTVFTRLRSAGMDVRATVAAHTDATAQRVAKSLSPSVKPHIDIVTGRVEQVLDHTDVALVVSGTASLQTAAHRRPMVVLYNVSPLAWYTVGRYLIDTRTFSLPNLISEHLRLGRVVPEYVPHFGNPRPVADAVERLLANDGLRKNQTHAFEQIAACFDGHDYASEAAEVICSG